MELDLCFIFIRTGWSFNSYYKYIEYKLGREEEIKGRKSISTFFMKISSLLQEKTHNHSTVYHSLIFQYPDIQEIDHCFFKH
jgi:hypothetical protein